MDDSIKDNKEKTGLNNTIEIYSFIVIESPEGLRIKMQNGMELSVSRQIPKWVKGTVKIDDQVVPIIDLEAKKGKNHKKSVPIHA